jgi:hypothetical protein
MITIQTREDQVQFEQLHSQSRAVGAGKMRYAAAMHFYQKGALSEVALEIYRGLAKDDGASPLVVLAASGRQSEIELEPMP